MYNRLGLRGLEPVIAVIIILAVTIAVAIAVVGWITGLWGGLAAIEEVRIMPDSNITINPGTNDDELWLHIRNTAEQAIINKVEIVGSTAIIDLSQATLYESNGSRVDTTNKEILLAAGDELWIEIPLNTDLSPGTLYTVKVYTKAGNVYSISIEAKKSG